MSAVTTAIEGAYVIDPDPIADSRGFFARIWASEFIPGRSAVFLEFNNSFSARRGTLRGLHYQRAPHAEAKLVRCIRGAVFDVVVDLRHGSPTFGQWLGMELTADNRTLIFVPEGCAHGYLTLEDNCEVIYGATKPYHREAEQGIRWNDPRFGIEWPINDSLILSDKDQRWADYEQSGAERS